MRYWTVGSLLTFIYTCNWNSDEIGYFRESINNEPYLDNIFRDPHPLTNTQQCDASQTLFRRFPLGAWKNFQSWILDPANWSKSLCLHHWPSVEIKLPICRLAKLPKCTTILIFIKSRKTGHSLSRYTENSLNAVNTGNYSFASPQQRIYPRWSGRSIRLTKF